MSKELNRDHYVNEIDVLEWLYDENKYQKIRFEKDKCYQYKLNNKLHRFDGPAIESFDGKPGGYFLEGKKVSWEYHVNNHRYIVIDGILKEIKEERNESKPVSSSCQTK
jgi:hypothetical protein